MQPDPTTTPEPIHNADNRFWQERLRLLGVALRQKRALWITSVYALVAVLWIYFSDNALALLADPDTMLRWSVFKGIAFVLVTALLLQLLIGRAFSALELSRASLLIQSRQLARLNQGLESQVAERTEELKQALVRAEAADQMKSAFLATMSHELRTPLNSIIGFTGIVLQGLAGDLNDEQRKQLGMVQTSARHLLDLINDILDLSKIEAGQLKVSPGEFDPKASVEKVAGLMQPLVERKGLAFAVSVDPAVGNLVSDQRRFEQVLINLLNNAVKFTDQGGIRLTVAGVDSGNKDIGLCANAAICCKVEDTGIGIRKENIDSLFQPFLQVDSGLTRQHEGTGLGLAICHRLVELLGGRISVSSEFGKGSAFSFSLPSQTDFADE